MWDLVSGGPAWLARAGVEYGPTEAVVRVTVASIGEADSVRTSLPLERRPLPGTVIHLLDDGLRPVDGAGWESCPDSLTTEPRP